MQNKNRPISTTTTLLASLLFQRTGRSLKVQQGFEVSVLPIGANFSHQIFTHQEIYGAKSINCQDEKITKKYTGCLKKTEFYQIEHLEILLPVGKKYDICGKSANAQIGKAQFFRHPVVPQCFTVNCDDFF